MADLEAIVRAEEGKARDKKINDTASRLAKVKHNALTPTTTIERTAQRFEQHIHHALEAEDPEVREERFKRLIPQLPHPPNR